MGRPLIAFLEGKLGGSVGCSCPVTDIAVVVVVVVVVVIVVVLLFFLMLSPSI